jgi:hypothetical protein
LEAGDGLLALEGLGVVGEYCEMVVVAATSDYVKVMQRLGDRAGDVSNVYATSLGLSEQNRLTMCHAYALNLTLYCVLRCSTVDINIRTLASL